MGNASNVISESMAHDLMVITGVEETLDDNIDFLQKRNAKDKTEAVNRVGNVVSGLLIEELVDEFYQFYSKNPGLWDEAIKQCQRRCIEESVASGESKDKVTPGLSGKPNDYTATVAQPFTKEITEELNKVRVNPAEYATTLGTFYDRFVDDFVYATTDGKLIKTTEGRELVKETMAFLRQCPPAPPLKESLMLEEAAVDHTNDAGLNNLTGHKGSDFSTAKDRIERYGQWRGTMGENIDFGFTGAAEIVQHLLMDDNVPSRGHRLNIMNPAFGAVGCALGSHLSFQHCCVMDFAGSAIARADLVNEDTSVTFGSITDIKQHGALVKKLAVTIPYDKGDFLSDLLRDVAAGHQITVDYTHETRQCKITYLEPDRSVKIFTLSWS